MTLESAANVRARLIFRPWRTRSTADVGNSIILTTVLSAHTAGVLHCFTALEAPGEVSVRYSHGGPVVAGCTAQCVGISREACASSTVLSDLGGSPYGDEGSIAIRNIAHARHCDRVQSAALPSTPKTAEAGSLDNPTRPAGWEVEPGRNASACSDEAMREIALSA